jgi:hypothetical protein
MQQQHCWVEGLVVAGLLASHSPAKATPVSPAPPIRLTLQHWGVNIGQHSWDLSGARTAESLHEDAATSRQRGKGRFRGEANSSSDR